MSTSSVIILIAVIVAVAVVGWMYLQTQRTRKLRARYGKEYDRAVDQFGDRRRAETDLEERQKRIELLNIRQLTREECDRFSTAWHKEQEHFVDDPHSAVARADELVREAMGSRGYPTGDFEQRVADISVDHPHLVEHYRAAHQIALRDERGEATTEDLRTAMQHFRQLFEELLDKSVNDKPVTDKPVNRFEEVRR